MNKEFFENAIKLIDCHFRPVSISLYDPIDLGYEDMANEEYISIDNRSGTRFITRIDGEYNKYKIMCLLYDLGHECYYFDERSTGGLEEDRYDLQGMIYIIDEKPHHRKYLHQDAMLIAFTEEQRERWREIFNEETTI